MLALSGDDNALPSIMIATRAGRRHRPGSKTGPEIQRNGVETTPLAGTMTDTITGSGCNPAVTLRLIGRER